MQSLTDILRKRNHLLLLQSASNQLHAHVRAVVDLGVICVIRQFPILSLQQTSIVPSTECIRSEEEEEEEELTGILRLLVNLTNSLEPLILLINILINLRDGHDDARVVQQVHETRVRQVRVLLRPGSGKRCERADNGVHRATSTAELCGRVPVLHVVLLGFALGNVDGHDFGGAVLWVVGTDELWCWFLAGQAEVVFGVGAAVEGVDFAGEVANVGVRRCGFPVNYCVAAGAESVDDELESAGDGWVDCACAVVGQDGERERSFGTSVRV